MTSSLICINLSLIADWPQAGETEAARSIHPFQFHPRALVPDHRGCARARADRQAPFHSVLPGDAHLFYHRISSENSGSGSPFERQSSGFIHGIIVVFRRFSVTTTGCLVSLGKNRRRREYRLGVAGGKALKIR